MRLDITSTASLHLKLPDRTDLVYDEAYHTMRKQVRRTILEYLASEGVQHIASFAVYKEALQLDIPIQPAVPYLQPFFVSARDSNSGQEPFNGDRAITWLRFTTRLSALSCVWMTTTPTHSLHVRPGFQGPPASASACAGELRLQRLFLEIMSKSLITIDPDASLKAAARLMSTNKIRRLPVVKQNRLVGIVVAADFVRNLGKKTASEEILEAMGRYPSTFP